MIKIIIMMLISSQSTEQMLHGLERQVDGSYIPSEIEIPEDFHIHSINITVSNVTEIIEEPQMPEDKLLRGAIQQSESAAVPPTQKQSSTPLDETRPTKKESKADSRSTDTESEDSEEGPLGTVMMWLGIVGSGCTISAGAYRLKQQHIGEHGWRRT